jgi:hypothetical protein
MAGFRDRIYLLFLLSLRRLRLALLPPNRKSLGHRGKRRGGLTISVVVIVIIIRLLSC